LSLTPRMQGRSAAEPFFYRVFALRGVATQEAARRVFRPNIVTRIDPLITLSMALGLSGASPHHSNADTRMSVYS
jgi:hypothetical protein